MDKQEKINKSTNICIDKAYKVPQETSRELERVAGQLSVHIIDSS